MSTKVDHHSQGDPCLRCGLSAERHRKRIWKQRLGDRHKREWVGLDGEGITKNNRKHYYISLCWSNATGDKKDKIINENGLSTEECLNFIMTIPPSMRIAGFALGYDLSKILEDLPNEKIYELTHPASRRLNNGRYRTVRYKRFRLHLLSTQLTIQKGKGKGSQRIIHDIFKFFNTSFVNTLEKWDIGTKESRDEMQLMKEERSRFDKKTTNEIIEYSLNETKYMAELATKLVRSHKDIGLKLRMFFGAGSSAMAMLEDIDLKMHMMSCPPEIEEAATYAFFGGRFELSEQGEINMPVHDWDISSAYPYQICRLPCLECGNWTFTNDIDEAKEADIALIHYSLNSWKHALPAFGPFPFRDEDGSIPYPIEGNGGWVYKDEFFAGLKIFPNIQFKEAWVFKEKWNCRHHRPFRKIPEWYLQRLKLGKETKGIVLKLGLNSIYGKLVQGIGRAIYRNMIWGGMITSGCRAQLLEMLSMHENMSDVLMIATDGLWSKKLVTAPNPRDTGTFQCEKPLGGWEHGLFPHGVFMARPGIYFPLQATDEQYKKAKARGIGTKDLWKYREEIRLHYKKYPRIQFQFKKGMLQARFIGMKGGISITQNRSDDYGKWVLPERILSFNPMPKRDNHFQVRRLPINQVSKPYTRGSNDVEWSESLEWSNNEKIIGNTDQADLY